MIGIIGAVCCSIAEIVTAQADSVNQDLNQVRRQAHSL